MNKISAIVNIKWLKIMHLPDNYQTTITETAIQIFGEKATVCLFGSRLDDNAIEARSLRNSLVHEYIEDIDLLRQNILRALELVPMLEIVTKKFCQTVFKQEKHES